MFCLSAYSQGIEFSTYESETVQKTSYSVFTEESPTFTGWFSLNFDLAIHDHSSFGYIFRVKDKRTTDSDTYSLVFSYNTYSHSDLKFNIEAREGRMFDVLDNSALRPRHWLPVTVKFFLEDDSVSMTVQDKYFVTHNLGLPDTMQPDVLFGSSTFSQEMPPFAIRNLSVESNGKKYLFPLNESSGSEVHDDKGKVVGSTINPVWLINKSYHWNLTYSFASQQVAGTNYNPLAGEILIFNRDSLIKADLSRGRSETFTPPPLPMDIKLGTNFYDPVSHQLYIYEVDNKSGGVTVGALQIDSMRFSPISNASLPSQRHHHGCYLDGKNRKYYIFGGFGSRQYYNELVVFNLNTGQWDTVSLTGDPITPRFFSGMTALNEDELLLFGGTGNSSGDQAIGKLHYYDLYRLNVHTGAVKKLWEFSNRGEDFVPVRELILSADEEAFYTMCYPMHLASSYLQLYRFSLKDGSYTILGDSVPMDSKAILSNANIYYNAHTNEYYCCVQEFQEYGGDPSKVKVYTLAAPAIPAEMLHIYASRSLLPLLEQVILFIVVMFVVFVLIRRRKKNKKEPEPVVPQISESIHMPSGKNNSEIKENSIYLFGEFTVYDKKGRDVAYMFSNKIKHLFLLTLLKSLDGSGGITSSYMYGVLWPDKDTKSAKNLKGVFISRLRKVLEELEGIAFTYNNNHYTIELSADVYCDYKQYLTLVEHLKDSDTTNKELPLQLAGILKRGKFMRSVSLESFDNIKATEEEKLLALLPFELSKLYADAIYDTVIELSEAILQIDPFNDTALWYLLNAYHKQRKEDVAMKKYYLFVAEYSKTMGEEYGRAYSDIIKSDIK